MDPLSSYQIKNFFQKHSPITMKACHVKAVALAGGGVAESTPGQGAQSYTVRITNGTKKVIVQFRDPAYPLDVDLVVAAQETYGQLVPSCKHLEGQLDPLHVYTMNDVSGVGFNTVRDILLRPENGHLLARTIQDFAVFCAAAWHNRPASMPIWTNDSIQLDYLSHLECLSNGLPDRFQTLLNELRAQLPSLFEGYLPMVINHWDLLENNIHVDAQTGCLTGIVDWRDARMGPFGTQFWGLENILGIRTGDGMRFHANHIELRRLFWDTLYKRIGDVPESARAGIRAARMIGIFFANDDFEDDFPVKEGTRELAVLESVTLGLLDVYSIDAS